jgi:hypothetical protein
VCRLTWLLVHGRINAAVVDYVVNMFIINISKTISGWVHNLSLLRRRATKMFEAMFAVRGSQYTLRTNYTFFHRASRHMRVAKPT